MGSAAVLALGLCVLAAVDCAYEDPPAEMAGYGEPVPWEGTRREDWTLFIAPYVGTSLSIRSSGTGPG